MVKRVSLYTFLRQLQHTITQYDNIINNFTINYHQPAVSLQQRLKTRPHFLKKKQKAPPKWSRSIKSMGRGQTLNIGTGSSPALRQGDVPSPPSQSS